MVFNGNLKNYNLNRISCTKRFNQKGSYVGNLVRKVLK